MKAIGGQLGLLDVGQASGRPVAPRGAPSARTAEGGETAATGDGMAQEDLFSVDALPGMHPEFRGWWWRAASWFRVPVRYRCRWCAAEEDCPRHGVPLRSPHGGRAGFASHPCWYAGGRQIGLDYGPSDPRGRRPRRQMAHERLDPADPETGLVADEGAAEPVDRAVTSPFKVSSFQPPPEFRFQEPEVMVCLEGMPSLSPKQRRTRAQREAMLR